MTRGSSEPPWAEGVSTVPFRAASLASLQRASRARRWGFDRPELARIQSYFRTEGREPTDVELAALAQSWSEHCSYKSSRPILRRRFARLRADRRVLGTGDAGVMRLEPGFAYALRIESHNHPSAVEPYGGAATGIGGILRDVLAVGARPIALVDPLFFGPLDLPRDEVPAGVHAPGYLFSGVVAGIRDYGNRVGVPTVSGGIFFDPAYVVNPLVNVGCVGLLPRDHLIPNRARRPGDRLVLVGGRTGRDGIGGVAFASRELDEDSGAESRGAVQLGNPIIKEPLIHACLEAIERGWIAGMKDLGGGGLATASAELVHAGGFGLDIDLARVPLREPGLAPWEIWISESQERMILDVAPAHVDRLAEIFARHDVPYSDLGTVGRSPMETVRFDGALAAQLRLGFRVDPPPKRRPMRARARRRSAGSLRAPDLAGLFEALVLDPASRSREGVIRVYDHDVQGRTAVRSLQGRPESPSHGDATVLRPRAESWTGLAITVATGPWICREDPYLGAVSVVEEAARNLYAVGARPDAFTNCLNFGNPEDPRVLGDFDRVVHGLADGARALGFAVPSGNVSFYNGGIRREIPPTPVLMATGILEDLRRATTTDLKSAGDRLYLVGPSRPELGGSLWSRIERRTSLSVPSPDPARLRRNGEGLRRSQRHGCVRAAHDVSEGGLAVALAEMAFGGGLGFDVDLVATGLDSAALALAAEGGSRWVVEVPQASHATFERTLRGVPVALLGTVTDGRALVRFGSEPPIELELPRLERQWRHGPGAP
ncbi:MAG: phosphoribosylformylglycinamidine synthase subunit PurL [Thermoplasmata archaeon]